ncbi:MAG: hypothetical protein R2771_12155 [Saprospiraceae bacterium]
MPNTKTTNNIIAFAIIAIIALLGSTAYFWVKYNNATKSNDKLNTEISQMTETQDKLENDYQQAVSSLEDLKSDNLELNELIDKQKAELKAQKDKISKQLAVSKNYDAAKKEIEALKLQAQDYINQINDLKQKNQLLTDSNNQLESDKVNLTNKLETTTYEKNAISQQKDSLAGAKKILEKENAKLFVTANKAAALELTDISTKPYKVKSNGSYSKESSADEMQLLKICFDMKKNEYAEKGQEAFYLRLIAPDGNTVYNEKLGSGNFVKSSDKSKVNYTKKYFVDYNGNDEEVCLIWNKEIELMKGRYQVELYNKGYLAGTSDFKLK